jgi:hypothetical protein
MAYWYARVFATIGLISPIVCVLAVSGADLGLGKIIGGPHEAIAMSMAALSLLTLLLATIGASLTIFFGWSADQRKLERLELEIEERGQISN